MSSSPLRGTLAVVVVLPSVVVLPASAADTITVTVEQQTVAQARCFGRLATIVGTNGADGRTGTDGADVIALRAGNDSVRSSGGSDSVCGDGGNDRITTGRGTNLVSHGTGSPTSANGSPCAGASASNLALRAAPAHGPQRLLRTGIVDALMCPCLLSIRVLTNLSGVRPFFT